MQNLNEKFVIYSFVKQLFGIMVLIWLVGITAFTIMGPLFAIVAALLVAVLSYGWSILVHKNYMYSLESVEFKKELGVINKKYVSIPYSRIQNVDINRGWLERMFGLSTLKIQTAGASAHHVSFGMSAAGAEGTLPGLSHEVAEQLRGELIQRSQGGGQVVSPQLNQSEST